MAPGLRRGDSFPKRTSSASKANRLNYTRDKPRGLYACIFNVSSASKENMRTSPGIEQAYIRETFGSEPDGLAQVRGRGESLAPGMQLSPAEGKLLAVLTALKKPMHILEIGCFVGYSALWMASRLGEGGRITTIERDAQHARIARGHFEKLDRKKCITLLEGDALETLTRLADARHPLPHAGEGWGEGVDMVFIDAEKRQYLDYLLALEPMLNAGALVVADNTFLFGEVYLESPTNASRQAWEAMRAFNARLADESLYEGILLPTPEGMTIGVKK
jgi:predicted O-methyltransferase YrrM